MQSNTSKFTGGTIRFLCFLFTINKPGFGIDEAIGVFDSIQATYVSRCPQSIA
jgi:hypothetical protein